MRKVNILRTKLENNFPLIFEKHEIASEINSPKNL